MRRIDRRANRTLTRWALVFGILAILFSGVGDARSRGDDGDNPFTYLDEYSNPYYAHTAFPKLTTPQWVGEPGVEAVVVLGIDDMQDSAKYEAYLRPILNPSRSMLRARNDSNVTFRFLHLSIKLTTIPIPS